MGLILTNLSKRCVQRGKRCGNPKDKDNRQGRVAGEKENQVLHCWSSHGFKLLDNDHQRWSSCFAVSFGIPAR